MSTANADALNKLVQIGYLTSSTGHMDAAAVRAVTRFQRHAARSYRMPQPDASPGDLFTGRPNGVIDSATAAEVDKWIRKGWKVPVGRFPTRTLSEGGRLRVDAAAAWEQIIKLASAAGATLRGPYGDTTRPVRPNSKVGTSRYSFHYSGRAVDINQAFGGGKDQRYYIARETVGVDTYWRLHCKTDNQDGSQGVQRKKGEVRCYSFTAWSEYDIPEGCYVDLTALIESTGTFERIKAQSNWSGKYNKTEWWHFQFKVDKQATFSDELELVGYSEAQLRTCGWGTNAHLDHKPG